jgi:hypothetical protein
MNENQLIDLINSFIIPGINVKSKNGQFSYYADIALDELKKKGLINNEDIVFEFDYEMSAIEDHINLEGYRVRIHVRGQNLLYNNNCIFDEVYSLNYFKLPTILSDLEAQNLKELAAAIYERIENKSFTDRPRPRTISATDAEWQGIENRAEAQGITPSEYIIKSCLL